MEKWRNKIGLAVLASTALLAFAPGSSAYGRDYCDPCYSGCDTCGCNFSGLEVGVDFLWWKPVVDDLDFAAKVENPEEGVFHVKYKQICPDWEPGVRVYAALPDFYCGLGLAVSYTWIESDNRDNLRHTSEIASPLVHPASDDECSLFDHAKGKYDLTYNEWDVLAFYDIVCNDCHRFRPFFGVAGITLDQDLKVHLDENHIKWTDNVWGVGLRLGALYTYRLSDCLSLFACAHGTLLAGKADSTNHQDFDNTVKIKDDNDCCHFIPGYHIGAGVNYNTCLCDWDLSFRLGYEFLVWHNIPNQRRFSGIPLEDDDDCFGSFSHSDSNSTRTLGFHGLLAGVGISF